MAILNYTTQVSEDKTIAEIERILIDKGASKILKDYEDGNVSSISFMIKTHKGMIPFALPMEEDKVMQIINKQTNTYTGKGAKRRLVVPKKFYNDKSQARRVGWRILKDWIEAQMAIIEIGLVTIDQVFLPYMQDNQGETLYNKFVKSDYKGYLLENQGEQ